MGEIEQEQDQCHQNASRQWFAENEIHYFKAWGQSFVIGDFPSVFNNSVATPWHVKSE